MRAFRPTLKSWLTLVVVAPLASGLGGVGLLLGSGARSAAEDVSVRLHQEAGRRIRAEILPWLDTPHDVNAANAELYATAGPLDDLAWRRHLWRQLGGVPEVGYVQIGWAHDGGFVGVERTPDTGFHAEISDEGRTGKGVWALGADGEPVGERLSFVDGYDARKRPWYRAAEAAGAATWSPIYQFSSRQDVRLGITAVAPVVRDGRTVAVVGADLVVSQLSGLLQDHSLGEGSRVVLVERDGKLVASSADASPFEVGADGKAVRRSASSCGDPVVEAAVRGAEGADGSLADVVGEGTFRTDDLWVFAAPLADGRGLDWVLVVAVPADQVLGHLRADLATTVGLGLLVLAGAVGASVVLAGRLTRPLLELSVAARELAGGNWDTKLPPALTVETESLVQAFDAMRAELRCTIADAEQARRAAEEASSAKSLFLHGVSHELRTPLTAILGYTDLLLEDVGPDSPHRRDLERVATSARSLLTVINEILDLARVESGRLTLTIGTVDVAALVAEVVAELRPMVEARGNRLVLEGPPAPLVAESDPARLRQIVVNLLGNAAKFTDDGTVTVSVGRDGEHVVVAVADTGIGFAPELIPTLFRPFERASGVAGREGTGLGLSIVSRLVEALAGTLEVVSRPGRGSRFTVRLPAGSDPGRPRR